MHRVKLPNCLLLLGAVIAGNGCGGNRGPVPASGYNMEQVSYKPAPVPSALAISVPEQAVAESFRSPVQLEVKETLSLNLDLAFEGIVRVSDPAQAGGIVRVEFYQPMPDGRRHITATGQHVVPWTESPDGHLHFRVELKAPSTRGRQFVEVQLYHSPTGGKEFFPIATGEVVVE